MDKKVFLISKVPIQFKDAEENEPKIEMEPLSIIEKKNRNKLQPFDASQKSRPSRLIMREAFPRLDSDGKTHRLMPSNSRHESNRITSAHIKLS